MGYLELLKEGQRRWKKQEISPSKKDDDSPLTIAKVLRIFPGARVEAEDKPISCWHCDERKTPNKEGKIVLQTWPNGSQVWACHACGRKAKPIKGTTTRDM